MTIELRGRHHVRSTARPRRHNGPVRFRRVASDHPAARELLEGFDRDVGELYPDWDPQRGPSAEPADFSAPGGAFLVGYLDDEPVACGGIKALATPDLGEIKRMYVVSGVRGRGVGRELLAALEGLARDIGYRRVRLDTGASQPHARRLYGRVGYQMITDYNGNPFASYWFERELSAEPTRV